MTADTETLWAVIVGAVLATVGGFAATQLEGFLRRRQRERSAALLFGEILSVIELITALADHSRGQGDPYGSFTMRLMRAVRRETDAYDRNRESLYDLRDAKLRAQIHALMVRITLTLEGVFDATEQIGMTETALKALDAGDPAVGELTERLQVLEEARASAFDFVVETTAETKPIIEVLKPLAKETFEAYATVVQRPGAG
ncbi:MAG TPA: hypothetical protein VHZ26_18885 [Caulobacteraceae bacterium]|jgi:hypothetical protein|nr:hypothetical protein [Caulobacteraceae bacterium]